MQCGVCGPHEIHNMCGVSVSTIPHASILSFTHCFLYFIRRTIWYPILLCTIHIDQYWNWNRSPFAIEVKKRRKETGQQFARLFRLKKTRKTNFTIIYHLCRSSGLQLFLFSSFKMKRIAEKMAHEIEKHKRKSQNHKSIVDNNGNRWQIQEIPNRRINDGIQATNRYVIDDDWCLFCVEISHVPIYLTATTYT